MTAWWAELSDDELRSRLMNRGMPESHASSWVEWRDALGAEEMINGFLGEEDGG